MSHNSSFTQMSLSELLHERNNIKSMLTETHTRYKNLQKMDDLIKNYIAKSCKHNWVIDLTDCSEHVTYYCKICKIYSGYYEGIFYHPKTSNI